MAPHSRPQPLPNDLIPDILLRLPPDDPAGLVRASAVCKAWRCIIAHPTFHGRYRELHPKAPVLGFLHRPSRNEGLPRFVSTTSFRSAAANHHQHPLDCRHGRAIFYDYGSLSSDGILGCYVVWDPATGEQHEIPGLTNEALIHATVFCADAAGGCDHRGCSGGPFIVAFAGLEIIEDLDDFDNDDETSDGDDAENEDKERLRFVDAHACFYSSDTGKWGVHTSIHLNEGRYKLDEQRPAALVGDSLYYLCWPGILRYRYSLLRGLDIMGMISARIRQADVLSMMELPRGEHLGIGKNTDMILMEAEGGGLGLAYLCPKTRTNIYLLARETEGIVGDDRWVQRRVIDLKTLLPVGNPKRKPCFRGVAQDANVIFVSTEDGVFSIDLGSLLQARKVCDKGVVDDWMYPFVSFYTESLLLKLSSGKLPAPVKKTRSVGETRSKKRKLPAPVGNQ